jgi:hypothetical protein
MAARIEVVLGPSKGWQWRFRNTELRIGRGPRQNVKVQDPAWGDGYLRVQDVANGYQVTNDMPHGVFLDGAILEKGQVRTWFPGSRLQPTAATVLVLHVDDGNEAGLPVRGVQAVPPSRKKEIARGPQYLLLGLLLGTLLLLLRFGSADSGPKSATELTGRWGEVEQHLQDLASDRSYQREAASVHNRLRDARFHEARERPLDALASYFTIRDELQRWSSQVKSEDKATTHLRSVRDYVAERIADLVAAYGLPKPRN